MSTPPDPSPRGRLGDLGRRAHDLASQASARATDAAAQIPQRVTTHVPQRLRTLVPGTGTHERMDAPAPGDAQHQPPGGYPAPGGAREDGAAPRPPSAPSAGAPPPRLTGTPFARTLATALGSRPHTLGLGTRVFGSSPPRYLFSLGLRLRQHIRTHGYAASADPERDAQVLGHVHGELLVSLQEWPRRTGKQGHPITSILPTRLEQVQVSAEQAQAGALPWQRLCVDTDNSLRLRDMFNERHLDVVIAPVGREPSEYAADLQLLLPEGLPAPVAEALRAAPPGRTVRLHLLDQDRVAVDLAEKVVTVFEGVPHHGAASLTVRDGRVERAEVWLGQRRTWPLFSLLPDWPPS